MVCGCLSRAQRVITDALGHMTDTSARREIPRTWTIPRNVRTLNHFNSIAPLTLIYNADNINWL